MPQKSDPRAISGGILFALAAVRCFGLGEGVFARLFLPGYMALIGALAVWLLYREGCPRSTLAAMLPSVGAALFLRALLLPHATLDYQDFLSQWVAYFRENGGFSALRDHLYSCNYNVPYLYMLCFLTYLPIPDLYGIKLFSILFDVLLAWGGLRLVRHLTRDRRAGAVCFSALLLLPTVLLNGAAWGQCDAVWGALCVLALACALEGKPGRSTVLLALAFSFKLQAIFFIPLWLALWCSRRVRLRHLLLFPAAFFASIFPALLLGKPLGDILGVYLGQASDSVGWGTLNYNSPSLFSLFPYGFRLPAAAPKLAIALAFLFMFFILGLLLRRRARLRDGCFVLAGAALTLGIPFFLPYMHERYFFLGGVLLTVWACARPRCAPYAVCAELASLGGYHAYLMKRYVMSVTLFGVSWAQPGEGVLMAAALAGTVCTLLRETERGEGLSYFSSDSEIRRPGPGA